MTVGYGDENLRMRMKAKLLDTIARAGTYHASLCERNCNAQHSGGCHVYRGNRGIFGMKHLQIEVNGERRIPTTQNANV